jgi:hypothetical protein
MKLSELINELQSLLVEHGDIPVQKWQGYDSSPVELQPEDVGIITGGKMAFDGATNKVVDLG